MKKPAKPTRKTRALKPAAQADLIKLIDQRIALAITDRSAPARAAGPPRFVKIGANDQVLPDSAKNWDWVYDRHQQLLIAAEIIEGEFNFNAAQAAAAKAHPQARSLEVQELVSVLDYSKHSPAVDTAFFRWKPTCVWTGTKAAWSPSGYAWSVNLYYGYAGYWYQSGPNCALACRPGQFLGL